MQFLHMSIHVLKFGSQAFLKIFIGFSLTFWSKCAFLVEVVYVSQSAYVLIVSKMHSYTHLTFVSHLEVFTCMPISQYILLLHSFFIACVWCKAP